MFMFSFEIWSYLEWMGMANEAHNHTSDAVNAMTGFSIRFKENVVNVFLKQLWLILMPILNTLNS